MINLCPVFTLHDDLRRNLTLWVALKRTSLVEHRWANEQIIKYAPVSKRRKVRLDLNLLHNTWNSGYLAGYAAAAIARTAHFSQVDIDDKHGPSRLKSLYKEANGKSKLQYFQGRTLLPLISPNIHQDTDPLLHSWADNTIASIYAYISIPGMSINQKSFPNIDDRCDEHVLNK